MSSNREDVLGEFYDLAIWGNPLESPPQNPPQVMDHHLHR